MQVVRCFPRTKTAILQKSVNPDLHAGVGTTAQNENLRALAVELESRISSSILC